MSWRVLVALVLVGVLQAWGDENKAEPQVVTTITDSNTSAHPEEANTAPSDAKGIDDLFASIDQHIHAARTGWDDIFEENHLHQDTRMALLSADNAIVDANATFAASEQVLEKSEESHTFDEKGVAAAQKSVESSQKVLQDGLALKEDAEEARRWVEKLLEKVNIVAEDSKVSREAAAESRGLAEESSVRDTIMVNSVKSLLSQSERAVHEASESKSMLEKLEQQQQQFQKEAEVANHAMAEAQREEESLRQKGAELQRTLTAEREQNTKMQTELERVKTEYESAMRALNDQLSAERTSREEALAKLTEKEKAAKALEEAVAEKEKEKESIETEAKQQSAQQVRIAEEAIASARQAREGAEQSAARAKEADERAAKLQQELEQVKLRMHEKLELARNRTKEWLRQQTTEFNEAQQQTQSEVNRLKIELENVEREEREERQRQKDEIEKVKQQTAEEIRRQMLKERPQPPHPVTAALIPDTTALQVEESSAEPVKVTQIAKAQTAGKAQEKSTASVKQALYDKMMEAHSRLQKLLESQSPVRGLASPPADFERDTSNPVLKRRERKLDSSDRLPSGYPPPMGTARLQDVTALEIDSNRSGFGDPIIAQGSNTPENALKLSPAHRDNCIRICSGGDQTVYRDGKVSTQPDEQSKTHTPGACMKLCAMFSVDATESK